MSTTDAVKYTPYPDGMQAFDYVSRRSESSFDSQPDDLESATTALSTPTPGLDSKKGQGYGYKANLWSAFKGLDRLDKYYSAKVASHTSTLGNVVMFAPAHFFNRKNSVISVVLSLIVGMIFH